MIARRRRKRYVVTRQFMNTEIVRDGVAAVTFSYIGVRAFASRAEAAAMKESLGWQYFVAKRNRFTESAAT